MMSIGSTLVAAHSVTCLDFSSQIDRSGSATVGPFSSRANLVCADASDWSCDDQFDAVVSCNALVYKELDLPESYSRYVGALRHGGSFLNSTVVLTSQDRFAELVANKLAPEDAGQYSSAVNAFAEGARC